MTAVVKLSSIFFLVASSILTQEFSNSFASSQGLFDAGLKNTVPASMMPPAIIEGKTSAKVVIDKVVSYPLAGDPDMIVLRNIGGQVANLKGWIIADNKSSGAMADKYVFGKAGCENNATINPMETLVLTPYTQQNQCGFEFGISFRDEINLYNEESELVASVQWSSSEQGTAFHRISDDNYITLKQHNSTILDALQEAGIFTMLLEALEITGIADTIRSPRNPDYDGPYLPLLSPPPAIEIVFPWWFGFQVDRSQLPPPPPPPPSPPPPPMGMPQMGPYTLLAPTDEAFANLLKQLGNANNPLPKDKFFQLPELKDILLYHIIYGDFTTDYLYNNTGLQTAKGPEIVISKDASQTEGVIAFNDACVDKQTPDQYTCMQQKEFNKCYDSFMISPTAANWQGGYCQRTCLRCTCSLTADMRCSLLTVPDLVAENGIVHGVSRVLFPPPVFTKEEVIEQQKQTEVEQVKAPASDSTQLPTGISLPALPSIPPLQSLSISALGLPSESAQLTK